MNPLVLLITGLIILVFFGTVAGVYLTSKNRQKNRMLSVIQGKGTTLGPKDKISEQDKRRADLAKKLKEQEMSEGRKGKATLAMQLQQAGIQVSPRRFMINSALFALGFMLFVKVMMGQSVLITALAGITGFFGLPRYFIRWRTKRRQKKFLSEFADALEAMVRLLRAGMPVGEAIAMASREFTGPVGEEMARIYDEQKIGVPMAEACLYAAQRMPLTEMQMFATGIAIQAQTGASLSEVLTNLAGVIRARFRLKRKVQALSSEAKSSAMIIGSLPFVVGGGLMAINPDYMEPLLTSTVGKGLLIGCAVWMGMGIFVMKAMINFKI